MAEIVVAKSADLTAGGMMAVVAGSKRLVLFRLHDGRLAALDDRCSHAEVRLSGGTFEGYEVVCPAHGARFDVCSGKHLCMPAVTGVKSYRIFEKGEDLVVDVPV